MFQKHVLYGQLQHVICPSLRIPNRGTAELTTFVLAIIQVCEITTTSDLRDGSFTLHSTRDGFKGVTVVDVSDILGVAARVCDRGQYYFVEQPGSMDFFKNVLHIEEA